MAMFFLFGFGFRLMSEYDKGNQIWGKVLVKGSCGDLRGKRFFVFAFLYYL